MAAFSASAQARDGGGSFYNLVFDRECDWYFGGTGTTAADKASFIDSGKPDDFYTVALHEIGHIVGLDHQSDLDDVMQTFGGSVKSVKDGGAFRALSADDLNGARDLYSVPVPEPESVWLVLAGAGVLLLSRHQRRT